MMSGTNEGENAMRKHTAMINRRTVITAAVALGVGFPVPRLARAQKKYDAGVSDTEIRIGNILPYSGPYSSYGVLGKTEACFFEMINEQGGIHGRRISFISYDDAYTPPKTVEQARKLVESDQVLLIFSSLGTATNSAIHKYMNQNRVPHLFLASGATKWGDPQNFPWTMGFGPNYQSEGRVYAAHVLNNHANGKIAVLYQNDDYGKDYLKGFTDGLGDKAERMVIATATYEAADPTVDSQIVTLKSSGADIFLNISAPKFAAQAIRKMASLGWRPIHILNGISRSVEAVLKPAGVDNAKGILCAAYLKDPTDPAWKDDAGVKAWTSFMDKYFPEGSKADSNSVVGYTVAQALIEVLKQCGEDLTRENVMKQAANLRDLSLPILLPGITINTSPTDYFPIEQMQMVRFTGEHWEGFGPLISGGSAS
jgi:branched-chain amino acid transport system substrate-binding protein